VDKYVQNVKHFEHSKPEVLNMFEKKNRLKATAEEDAIMKKMWGIREEVE
jgi:hypothetical protein